MSIADLKSKFSDFIKNSSNNDVSITKKLESISSNFKSNPSIIAKDLEIEGNINGSGFVEIEGFIKGTINGNSIVLREEGVVEGEIVANSISIRGKFDGTVRAKNINITSKAKITGVIEYGSLSVEDGAYIDGQFKQIVFKSS
ncbi:MAG: polymer-forming cytoskeletal protein [Proteobacteria bacterium]|nr:polymer-forming cytoskeletal protein [Pseudomonadota bacterium]